MGGGVGIIAASEVAVVRGDNCEMKSRMVSVQQVLDDQKVRSRAQPWVRGMVEWNGTIDPSPRSKPRRNDKGNEQGWILT